MWLGGVLINNTEALVAVHDTRKVNSDVINKLACDVSGQPFRQIVRMRTFNRCSVSLTIDHFSAVI